MNTGDLKSFNYLENGEVHFSMFDTIKSTKEIEPGFYIISWIDYPKNEVVIRVNKDKESIKIHKFPDRSKIDSLLKSFFNDNVVYKLNDLGFNNKIGILFYGKEGTGKSTIIKYYCDNCITNNNAIVFYFSCSARYVLECWGFIRKIRNVQNNPIIIIFEEIDSFFTDKSYVGNIKTLLDGNLSIDNCVFLATTNHIDNIPESIKNRPSRFKYVLNIEGIQSQEDVYNIIFPMIGDLFDKDKMDEFAISLKGKTIDEIKQFCIDKIMNLKSYNNTMNKVGFKANKEND